MKRITLSTRGTDLVVAALRLPRKFSRTELNEEIGKSRVARGDVLPQHWKQGTSNELQRLSSDFAQYHKEHRELDLITRVASGQYCLRDEVRQKLIDAANERSDLLVSQNTLIVPVDDNDAVVVVTNHVIARYAHQMIAEEITRSGYKIIADTSKLNAYDFMFQRAERYATPQIMECKGTSRADGTFGLTYNEGKVLKSNESNYWFGVVYSITIADGKASGGEVFITKPPIHQKWIFTKRFRLKRIPEPCISQVPLPLSAT